MSDIYGQNRAAGDNYKAMLRAEYLDSKNEQHDEWMFDETKISLIYAHAHRIANFHPNDEIVIDFYDDHDGILAYVHGFFNEHADLLPKNVTLRLTKYDGQAATPYKKTIKGTGKIDAHYDWTVALFSDA